MKSLTNIWETERQELNQVKRVQTELETARRNFIAAKEKGDYIKAGELQHAVIPKLEEQMASIEANEKKETSSGNKKTRMLSDSVSADAIADIVSRKTGIPITRITGNESKKLLNMEQKLEEVNVFFMKGEEQIGMNVIGSHSMELFFCDTFFLEGSRTI